MSLFKYASIRGAKAILDSNAIRYSRSSEFNDPFDILVDALYGRHIFVNKEQMADTFVEKLISSKKIIPSAYNSPYMAQIIQFNLRRQSPEQIAEFKRQLGQMLLPDSENFDDKVRTTVMEIKRLFEQDAVTCFSEKNDIVPMWAHYAENHAGVVLEFKPNEKANSCLLLAKPVQYKHQRPLFHHTYEDFVETTFFKDFNSFIAEKINELHFTKSTEWEYEKEHRLVISHKIPLGEKYKDIPLFENEIVAVYFGCRAKDNDIFAIMERALKLNPHIEFYKMEVDTHEYKLNAKKIENKKGEIMAVNFSEALKELKDKSKNHSIKKIKLINGDIIEGVIVATYSDMIELKKEDKGAGQAVYTIPTSSILYISDCELA